MGSDLYISSLLDNETIFHLTKRTTNCLQFSSKPEDPSMYGELLKLTPCKNIFLATYKV